MSLFLMLSLTSCASESLKLTEPLPIPQTLLTKCYAPDYWVKTYGDFPSYVAELLSVVELCNNQISAIEDVVINDRQKKAPKYVDRGGQIKASYNENDDFYIPLITSPM